MSEPTYSSTTEQYRLQYSQHLEMRNVAPFIVPTDILGYLLLVIYIMLGRTTSPILKILYLLSISSLSILNLYTSRTLGLAYGVLVGISSAWCIILSVNVLFLSKPTDYKRRILPKSVLGADGSPTSASNHAAQWQAMPDSQHERLFWALDLLGSLRALHWSHRRPQGSSSSSIPRKHQQNTATLNQNLAKLLVIYFCIDCLKEIIAVDPYFWGYIYHTPPPYIRVYLFSKQLIQAYRMLVAFAVLYVAVLLISTVGVIIFVNMLGPRFTGTWGEQWAWDPQFGELSSILDTGLQGFWGNWWHQMFRLNVTMPANAVVTILQLPDQGLLARTIRLFVPFLISGAIHAAGSYTLWGDTNPLDALLFFALQPIGIAFQLGTNWILSQLLFRKGMPALACKTVNIGFTMLWLLKTFPLLADDFARGGLWLTEPFPFSAIQLLGLSTGYRRSFCMG